MQVKVPSMSGSLRMYLSAGMWKGCPPKVRWTSGMRGTASQSTMNSPNSAETPPRSLLSSVTSLVGPPTRLVPESMMAKQPPRQNLALGPMAGTSTLSMVTLKKPSRCTGT